MMKAFVVAIAIFSLGVSALPQGKGSSKSGKSQASVKQSSKSKSQMKAKIRWDQEKPWNDEFNLMRKKLRLTDSQGRQIGTINRDARNRILQAQRSGLRGEALSNRIREIRMDARRRIERIFTTDQRAKWRWRDDVHLEPVARRIRNDDKSGPDKGKGKGKSGKGG